MTNEDVIRLTIQICMAEVEKVIGTSVLATLDAGSPWGRAYIFALAAVQEADRGQIGQ